MAANDIPSELATSCLARLGLPLLIFDSGEVLIHCNIAASRTIPACRNSSVDTGGETSLHAKDLFSHSAIDTFDFATAGIISTAPVSAFSLARLVADHATKDATTGEEEDSLDSAGFPKSTGWGDDSLQGAECQAYLNIKSGREGRKAYWWQASISSFFGADERSHYFSVTLIQEIATPVARPIIPPEPNSQPSSLERPPLTRRASEKDAQAVTLDDVVPESGEASSLDMDFYKTAVESMSEILFVSAVSGVVTYLNNQWYKYVGWDPDDPDNRNRWAEVFHPDDVQLAVEAYGASVRSGDDIRLQYRVRRADGVFRWMIARGRPVRDHSGQIASFVSTLTDAEDLINARHEAVQARQHISTVLRAAAITLIVVDSSTQILMVDGYEMVRASLGLAATGNPAGQRLDQFWPDENCVEQVREILARWEAATNVSTSKSIAERDFMTQVGEHHLRYRVSPLYHSDNSAEAPQAKNIAGLAIVCTDVTAMVQAELALQESQRQREALAVSEEAAKEASRLKTVFVTSLSHEIRTPVASMLGISELLLADALSEKQRSLVAKQIQAGELLLSLVSMVLDIGKMEANKLEVELRPFFLADLLSDMDIFTSLAEAKGLYFRTAIHGDYAHALLGDRLRLAQVLFNFLNNAIKFTRKGGITLQVSVTSEASKCLVTCKVIDTGIGIASDTLPQLFKPFHQASVSTAREYGGSGLGLAIAKQLIELMGGTVELTSELGVGTVASLRVPLAKAPAASPSRFSPINGSSRLKSIDRAECSILIAEDNRLLQEVYSALVRKMGFTRITVADDGQHALECLDHADFSLILMDCEMPRLSGPDALAIIRAHPRPAVRSTKVIALTANALAGDNERFLAMKFDRYLSKPVRATTLEATILECLESDPSGTVE